MSANAAVLRCFAYGEHLDGPAQRSLGYRLLAPVRPEPWSPEVEALARRLQTTPYSDHWPPTDLFCSVLLADGARLVAVARYGLADHTPSSRRGGLELIGAVGPPDMTVEQALATYQWLRQRRANGDDLHTLGGTASLAEVVAAGPPKPASVDPIPVLPIRLWQEGALLFAATAPSDPDHRIGLLEQDAGGRWQWLPLVGADFPLQTYAQRGPLIAWTPHLAGVALKLDRKSPDAPAYSARARRLGFVALAAALALLGLLIAANLWATLTLSIRNPPYPEKVASENRPLATVQPSDGKGAGRPPRPAENGDSREAFAHALYALIAERGGQPEWETLREQLLARYERAARDHKELRLAEKDESGRRRQGREAVGAVVLLSERSARRIEEAIKKALTNRGYDAELVNLACQRVREQLIEETRKSP